MPLEPSAAGTARRRRVTRPRASIATVVCLTLAACAGSDGDGGSTADSVPSTTAARTTDPESSATGTTDPASTDTATGPTATDTTPIDPTPTATGGTDPAATDPDAVTPDGFTTVVARTTDADGETCDVCMWLADDGDERGRGLMGVTDLGAAGAMAFVFDQPTTGNFFMFRTLMPLSIAWFDADGDFVSSADMDPCLDTDSSRCPRYGPAGPYTTAIEVFRGDLGTLGIGPGSSIEIVPGTEADTCPAAEPAASAGV